MPVERKELKNELKSKEDYCNIKENISCETDENAIDNDFKDQTETETIDTIQDSCNLEEYISNSHFKKRFFMSNVQ